MTATGRTIRLFIAFSAGFACLCAAAAAPMTDWLVRGQYLIAALLVLLAYLVNRRLLRRCGGASLASRRRACLLLTALDALRYVCGFAAVVTAVAFGQHFVESAPASELAIVRPMGLIEIFLAVGIVLLGCFGMNMISRERLRRSEQGDGPALRRELRWNAVYTACVAVFFVAVTLANDSAFTRAFGGTTLHAVYSGVAELASAPVRFAEGPQGELLMNWLLRR